MTVVKQLVDSGVGISMMSDTSVHIFNHTQVSGIEVLNFTHFMPFLSSLSTPHPKYISYFLWSEAHYYAKQDTLLTNKVHIKGRQYWGNETGEGGITIFKTSLTRPLTWNHGLECSIFIVKVHIWIGSSLCEKVFKYIDKEQLIIKKYI